MLFAQRNGLFSVIPGKKQPEDGKIFRLFVMLPFLFTCFAGAGAQSSYSGYLAQRARTSSRTASLLFSKSVATR